MKPRILVVDDEAAHRKMLEVVLTAEGYVVQTAEDGHRAVEWVERQFHDLILMDIRMGAMDGIAAMKKIKEISPGIPIIIMTAYASVATAVYALKSGAYDYLTKPLDIDELKILVKKALHHHWLEEENRFLKERIDARFDFSRIIGRSEVMRALFETIAMVAPSDATVLITGESGTGKELVANAIHQNSSRKAFPFIKVNCAALPESLLESELFGHEKGAFTGATHRKKGRFHAAHQGSLLLDEIGEMSLVTQAKILRVLQEREFEPVGGTQIIKVDTRIIVATNRDLEAAIQMNQFREDLYFRLNVVPLEVPPLRERGEDIALLAEFFLKHYAKKNQKVLKGLNPRALDLLMRYEWPGNVRELENIIERAVILARGNVVTARDFPQALRHLDDEEDPSLQKIQSGQSLKAVEKELIINTLADNGGNRTQAARILGISRRTLQLKLKEYGVNP